MAQQTINVGAAPNDGTGTPLRTAFQYTNSNFSELYTAVGPSGNNIVVPGTATITGNLTVRTTGLVVNSTGASISNSTPLSGVDSGLLVGTVGSSKSVVVSMANCLARLRERDAVNNFAITTNIGPSGTIDDNTRSSWKIRIGSGNENFALERAPAGSATFQNLLNIDSGGVCAWGDGAGGTRMTLNATGLGIGTGPSYNIDVLAATLPTISVRSTLAGASNARLYLECAGANSGHITYNRSLQALQLGANGGTTAQVTLDSVGNVGIGVTPAGTGGCLQLKSGVTFPATQVASSDANTLDDYKEGSWVPTLNSGTLSSASCRFTKIGNMVTIFFDVTVGTGGGDRITNLPFAAASTSTVANGIYTNNQTYAAGTTAPVVVVGGSSSTLFFRTVGTGVAFSAMTLTAAANLTGSISYFV